MYQPLPVFFRPDQLPVLKSIQNTECQTPLEFQVYNIYLDYEITYTEKGMWWCSWLRNWATSQKVMGSIPDGVTGIFHWHNPSGHTKALGLTQPLTKMSTRNKGSWCIQLTTLPFMCQLSWNLGALTSWKPHGLSRHVIGLLYLFK